MKINSITSGNYVQNYQSNKSPSIQRDNLQNKVDQVTFSEEAKTFSRVLSNTKNIIEPRSAAEMAKIDDIKGRIGNGQYFINADLVAEKMLMLLDK